MRMTRNVQTLMREADPAPRDLGGDGDERARNDLERILRLGHLDAVSDGRPRRVARPRWRRTRLVPGLAAAAACTAAAVAFAVLSPGSAETGYAATPPPLTFTSDSSPVAGGTMLERIADRVGGLREPSGPESHLDYREWDLNTRVYADDPAVSEVTENAYEVVRHADGSGTTTRTYEDGHTDTYADEWELAPEDPEEFTAWLFDRPGDAGFGGAAGAAQITGDLLRAQALTPAQRAALLRAVADLPGLTYDGEVADRAGRVGQAFSAESAGGGLPSRYTFVVDPDSGSILGLEQTLTETAGALNVPIPSVIDYTVFLSAERTS